MNATNISLEDARHEDLRLAAIHVEAEIKKMDQAKTIHLLDHADQANGKKFFQASLDGFRTFFEVSDTFTPDDYDELGRTLRDLAFGVSVLSRKVKTGDRIKAGDISQADGFVEFSEKLQQRMGWRRWFKLEMQKYKNKIQGGRRFPPWDGDRGTL